MCLAVPSRIIEINENNESALMETLGIKQEAIIALLDEAVEPGDYVLIHAGFAIRKINLKEAAKTLQLHQELRQQQESASFTRSPERQPSQKQTPKENRTTP